MVTDKEIALIQTSFEKIRPISAKAAELFYANLFTMDPSLRHLFKKDMAEQGKMLMSVLSSAVRGLSNIDELVPVLSELGKRHAGYGVIDTHYLTVGAALIRTLEQGLSDEFTTEVRDAWCAAYELIADVMQTGAQEAIERKAA
mgnify:CR=1 FL=1